MTDGIEILLQRVRESKTGTVFFHYDSNSVTLPCGTVMDRDFYQELYDQAEGEPSGKASDS